MVKLPLILSIFMFLSSAVFAHDDSHEFFYEKTEVKGPISMLSGAGGNIAVLESFDDGLLIVDNGFDNNSTALKARLAGYGRPTTYVLNTHWHGDHTGANAALGDESTILAHENVRVRMAAGSEIGGKPIPPAPAHALPSITYQKATTIYFGDQSVSAVHLPNGHTDGDTVVFFEPAHVVHMGDMLFAGYFPYIDAGSGGSVAGYTKNLERLISMLDKESIVIPGHGSITDVEGVKASHEMILETTQTVKQMKAEGLTLEQAQQKGVGAKWQGWGDFFIDENRWIAILWAEI